MPTEVSLDSLIGVEMPYNPFQGLKRGKRKAKWSGSEVEMPYNPFQGLKQSPNLHSREGI
ncbi:conserved hypothetical protein [Planktothrix sp. PCC 11201]|nr:conserved hypothetical protein [Planktothrix sp. PCC 11201]